MKLITYKLNGIERLGALEGNKVIDLNYGYSALLAAQGEADPNSLAQAFVPADMIQFLNCGEIALVKAQEAVSFALEQNEVDVVDPLHFGVIIVFLIF